MENQGKSATKLHFGSGAVWGVIPIVNIIEGIAQKFRRIIVFHFGLVFFDFTSGNRHGAEG